MNLVQRVQDILLKPKDTWPVIESEPTTTAAIYTQYLVLLAAIPAIAGFIGMSLIGIGGFGFSYHVPLVEGLISAVVRYAVSLIMIFVLALIVDALAPTFNGTKNSNNALKLVAYGSTAGFVAGIFTLIPALAILGTLVALYSIYLIYIGLPVMMKCPPEKAIGYTVVVIVCAIVASLVLGVITSMTIGSPGFGNAGMFNRDNVSMTHSRDMNSDLAKMQAAAARMQDAGKQMQQAQGNPAAVADAAGGGAFPMQDLKALLPESIGDFKRTSIEANSASAGVTVTAVDAVYSSGTKEININITDMGSAYGTMMAKAMIANIAHEKETANVVEKGYSDGKRGFQESYQKDGSRADYVVFLENAIQIRTSGRGVDLAMLKNVVNSIGIDKIEAMNRPAK